MRTESLTSVIERLATAGPDGWRMRYEPEVRVADEPAALPTREPIWPGIGFVRLRSFPLGIWTLVDDDEVAVDVALVRDSKMTAWERPFRGRLTEVEVGYSIVVWQASRSIYETPVRWSNGRAGRPQAIHPSDVNDTLTRLVRSLGHRAARLASPLHLGVRGEQADEGIGDSVVPSG